MLAFFQLSSIRGQLLLSFLAVVFFLVISALSSVIFLQKADELTQYKDDVLRIKDVMEELRLLESDFLYQQQTDTIFHQSGQSELLDSISYYYLELEEQLTMLRKYDVHRVFGNVQDVEQLQDVVHQKEHEFIELVDLLRLKGHKDYGLIGEMRQKIHELEYDRALPLDEILLLRRHEKDMLLRKDLQYLHKLDEQCNAMILRLVGDSVQRSVDLKLLREYQDTFHQLVATMDAIGELDHNGQYQKSVAIGNMVTSGINNMVNETLEKEGEMRKNIRQTYFITVIIALLGGITVSFWLAAFHSRPYRQLSEKMKDIIANISQIQQMEKVEIREGSYEMRRLVFSFNKLLARLKEQIGIIEGSNRSLQDKNRELKKVNEELDHFVYRVSHDLRSPLTSVLGLVNLYKITKQETEKDDYVELIRTRIERLDEYIQDIIRISRNARTDLRFEKVNVQQLLQNTFEEHWHNQSKRKAYHIHFEGDQEIVCDKARLQIILGNLVSNSIRYNDPEKPKMKIAVKVKVSGNGIVISYTDNGLGIMSKHLERIFEMFFRGTTQSNGSGLGLYIVRETIGKMGGKIRVDSEYGEWTRFDIELPVCKEISSSGSVEQAAF